MESQIERISPVECRVRVEIPWEQVSGRLDQKLREVRRKARIPGFRPGKVPPPIIERMFGKSIREELARDLVQETFQTAVSEHDTRPLTQPVLESHSLEKDRPFSYAARFEVPPQLEPKDYEGVTVRRRPATADPEKVEAELQRKREALTELQPIPEGAEDQPTQPGDVWTIDFEGTIGEQPISRQDLQLEIGREQDEFIPGLLGALEGTTRSEVGTRKEIRFVTPASERLREEFREQEVEATVGLREVRIKHVPELDDEFARDTGEAETLDELRSNIEQKVLEEDQNEAERDARRRLVETLLERNPFEAAPSMISREVEAQVDLTKRQLAQQGVSLAQVGMDESQLAQQIRPQATFNVKAFLLLDAIGKAEGIEVSDEEFEQELASMAEERGQNLARMRAQMEKSGQLMVLRAQMREEKLLDHLMEKAEVTEAPDPELDDQIEQAAQRATTASDKAEEKTSRRKRRNKPKADAEQQGEGERAEGQQGEGEPSNTGG